MIMTKTFGTKKGKRSHIASHDLLIHLANPAAVSSEEVAFVFTQWGKVRDVHRPYEDRNYRFVRFERKEDMKAALRGYEDGSLRYLQPDWHQCTVYESPSNSLFEVIVRDIPAEITDKEWYDCIMHYGNIRALQRIPEQHSGVVDMFIAMEDQRSHDVIKALLITLSKYNATLSDIFYGTFVPPAAFSAGDSAGLKDPSSSNGNKFSSLRALRDFRSVSSCLLPSAIKSSDAPSRSYTGIQQPRSKDDVLKRMNKSTVDFPRGVPVTLLTRARANPAFLPFTLFPTTDDSKKAPSVAEETRKDPSDIWFSCGEECVSESPQPPPSLTVLQVKAAPERDNECSFLTDAKVMPRCESTVLNVSPARLGRLNAGLRSGSAGSSRKQQEGFLVEEAHSHTHTPQQSPNRWTLPPIHCSPIRRSSQRLRHRENRKDYKRRKRRESTLTDSFSNDSSQSTSKSPQAMYSYPGNRQASTRGHDSHQPENYHKIKEHSRRFGSDPTSLKHFMLSHNLAPLLDHSTPQAKKPTHFSPMASDRSPAAQDQKASSEDASKTSQAPASLMGVPFPCDQAPLRDYYNAAKMEGRVVTLRFSESKTSGLPLAPLKDNELSPEERIEENLLIAKWQHAHHIFQLRKRKAAREKSPCRRSVSPLYRSKPPSSSTLVTRRAYVEISDKLTTASLKSSGGARRHHLESRKPVSRLMCLFPQSSSELCTSSSAPNDERQPARRLPVLQHS